MAMQVQITSSKMDKYDQIIRASISGAKACEKLGHNDQAKVFIDLKQWADKEFNCLFDKKERR